MAYLLRSSSAAVARAGQLEQRRLLSSASSPRLVSLVDSFRRAVDKHVVLTHPDGKRVVFASAWLATDNIVVHLLHKHYPELLKGMTLLGVDTLHLFDETHAVAHQVQAKYGKPATVTKPNGCETRKDFERLYGHCEELNHADFDLHSKESEPYMRGKTQAQREILLTGRRSDQGEKRISLDIWEAEKRILNPMAEWLWPDITAFVDAEGVPVNAGHSYVFRSAVPIDAKQRHRDDLPWTKVMLNKPFWRATPEELAGSPPAAHTYVYKSFGDTHTTVPVYPHESERTGRFVRSANTECGIHTRAVVPGAPYGGKLVDRMVTDPAKRASLLATCTTSIELSERQSCDVELLCNGGFSPLTGFMSQTEYDHVVLHSRLPEQQLWPMPIVLDTNDAGLRKGDRVRLTYLGRDVAVLDVSSVWEPNKALEAQHVFGTTSLEHPGVHDLAALRGRFYAGGEVHGLELPTRPMACETPRQVRAKTAAALAAAGAPAGAAQPPIVAFQCRNPIHAAHFELIKRALATIPGSTVLVHPTVGPTQPGDIDAVTRVATYKALEAEVGQPRIVWAYLPFSMRMAGPREALAHMIVRKNFGCTHFIVGRDMAGTKSTLTSKDFYGAFDAQSAAKARELELAMTVVEFDNMVHTAEKGFLPEAEAASLGLKPSQLSGTAFRRMLRANEPIPEWFSFASVINVLRAATK